MAKIPAFARKARAQAWSTGRRARSLTSIFLCTVAAAERGRARHAHASTARATGSRAPNVARQPVDSTSAPAATGPIAKARPMAAFRCPSARPRADGAAASVMMPGAVP